METSYILMAMTNDGRVQSKEKQTEQPAANVITNLSLLDLPPEIWSKICHYTAIPRCMTARAFTTQIDDHYYWKKFLTQPAITRTCRAIRKECLGAFYENLYVLCSRRWSFYTLDKWLEAIGEENRKHVVIHDYDSFWSWRGNDPRFKHMRVSRHEDEYDAGWIGYDFERGDEEQGDVEDRDGEEGDVEDGSEEHEADEIEE